MARYKVLKSVAHSFGHSFTSLLNYSRDDYVMGHLLRAARESGVSTLTVDILTGMAAPRELMTAPVRESIEARVRWFPKLVAAHDTEMRYVSSARMTVSYDLSRRRPARYAPGCDESPYSCLVEIEDDRGKVWSAELVDWWFPEPVSPGGRTRARIHRVVERLGQSIRSVWSRTMVRPAAV